MDAAAPAPGAPAPEAPAAAPEAPAFEGIASLFPLLGDVTLSPLPSTLAAPSAFDAILAPPPADAMLAASAPATPATAASATAASAPAASAPAASAPAASAPAASAPADPGATQAIPAADIAVELAAPVAPYLVPQSAPVAIVPSWHAPEPLVTGRRSAHAAAAAQQGARLKQSQARDAHRTADRTAPRVVGRNSSDNAKPLRQRVFGVGVMVLVGGLFAVLAIPAYADNNATTLTAAAAVQTQKVAVANSAASTITTAARDGYTATSASDLKSLYAAAMRQQNIAEYLQSGAKAKGDDYPWFAELSRNQGGGLSPLGYYYRECVDFVAWRLNRDAGTTSAPFRWTWSTLTPNGGDGHQWKAAWLAHGWATGTTPVPGSVAWFGDNHVGYVNGILDNGQVLIEEYNYIPHAYGTRVINANQAYYLYAPPK